jgi:hypothetical protein
MMQELLRFIQEEQWEISIQHVAQMIKINIRDILIDLPAMLTFCGLEVLVAVLVIRPTQLFFGDVLISSLRGR